MGKYISARAALAGMAAITLAGVRFGREHVSGDVGRQPGGQRVGPGQR